MELDLRQLIAIARRWWWLLLLPPLIAANTSYYVSSQQEPLYSASVVLRINPPITSGLDQSAFNVSQNLGETYRSLITFTPVMQNVVTTLNLPYDANELKTKTTATSIRDTQLVRVSVSDTDPERASIIANTIAEEFTKYVQAEANLQIQTQVSTITSQISEIETQLAGIETELTRLDIAANAGNDEIQNQIDDLRTQRSQAQSRLDTLRQQASTIAADAATSQVLVSVSDPAEPPTAPYAPRTLFYGLLGGFVGFLIAIGAVALLEYLDNTIRSDTDITALTGATTLAAIAEIPKLKPGRQQIYSIGQPRSSASESVRLLRASLEFAAAAKPINSLAISSAGPGEGKSTITANLGVVMAQAGFSTIIVDADLRKPSQHKIFDISTTTGLTTLLTHPDRPWKDVAVRVAMPNLAVIPSGPIPPNPADLLSLDRFSNLLAQLEQDADIVLVDTPPVLAVSDPLLVASKTDGLILIGRPDNTRRDRFADAANALHKAGIRIVGVVLNQEHGKQAGYYYYYGTPENTPPEETSVIVRTESLSEKPPTV